MIIRKFKQEDAEEVSKIIKKNLLKINNVVYPKKTIDVLLEDTIPQSIIEKSKTRNYFIAIESDKIWGIGGYKEDEIHTFFVAPERHREGIGLKLLTKVLEEARKEGIKTLNCASTPYAEVFYASAGFERIEAKIVNYHNEDLKIIIMRKKL